MRSKIIICLRDNVDNLGRLQRTELIQLTEAQQKITSSEETFGKVTI